jgi:excisionase family DNA binding protein
MPSTLAPTRPHTESSWLTVSEVASRLSVSTTTIRRWIDAGVLHADHVGPRLVRIPTTELTRLSGGVR